MAKANGVPAGRSGSSRATVHRPFSYAPWAANRGSGPARSTASSSFHQHGPARGVPVVDLHRIIRIAHLQRRRHGTRLHREHDGRGVKESVIGFGGDLAKARLRRRVRDFRQGSGVLGWVGPRHLHQQLPAGARDVARPPCRDFQRCRLVGVVQRGRAVQADPVGGNLIPRCRRR